MQAMVINGGEPLKGTVTISGAKNAVLPILAATVISGGKYVLHNCPDITDVDHAVQILQTLGAQVTRVGTVLSVDTRQLCAWTVPAHLMLTMRASVLFLGPLLARFGRAELSAPGGCPLGRRPIDLHLEAVSRMGAAITLLEDRICCRAPVLHGCCIRLRFPSVGATENALMAAVACHGTVRIQNAAREPEVEDLIVFLQAMGADIRIEEDEITVCGEAVLHDADHTVVADRIEAATYMCAVAGCGGEIVLHRARQEHLVPVIEVLRQAGCVIEPCPEGLFLQRYGPLQAAGQIHTAPYPGFPTDAQAIVMAALLRAEGSSEFYDTVFEQRFAHIGHLRRFGARIDQNGCTATVRGTERLEPAQVQAGDLRAAAALIIAALQAEGRSTIFGLKHLYRGYDNPEGKLRALGAQIRLAQ